jgi:ferredoxin
MRVAKLLPYNHTLSMAYMINKSCTKCGACLPECPTGAISEGKTQFFIDSDACADHKACVNVCPVDAISKFADSSREEEEE